MLQTPKVAQKLPSTICLGLLPGAKRTRRGQNKRGGGEKCLKILISGGGQNIQGVGIF